MTNGLAVTTTYSSDLNLQEFVKNATWRELLTELIATNKIDPWDIDLIKVVDSYIDAVKKMRVMDLHIPANIILAASILLRMKSDTINILQIEETLEAEEPVQPGRVPPDVPNLVPRLRLQPKRKITLNELMDALGDAIKVNERRESIVRQRAEPVNIIIEKDDIDEKMSNAYNLVKQNVDREGMTTFAQLSASFSSIESKLLALFVPLLFLAHNGELILMQDEFFNEIFVKLNSDKDGSKAK
jgi:segregation and condensation protein A